MRMGINRNTTKWQQFLTNIEIHVLYRVAMLQRRMHTCKCLTLLDWPCRGWSLLAPQRGNSLVLGVHQTFQGWKGGQGSWGQGTALRDLVGSSHMPLSTPKWRSWAQGTMQWHDERERGGREGGRERGREWGRVGGREREGVRESGKVGERDRDG